VHQVSQRTARFQASGLDCLQNLHFNQHLMDGFAIRVTGLGPDPDKPLVFECFCVRCGMVLFERTIFVTDETSVEQAEALGWVDGEACVKHRCVSGPPESH